MTIKKETIIEFFDNNLRAEQIIHIGTMCLDEDLDRNINDLFNDDCDDLFSAMGCSSPEDREDDISYYLRNEVKKQGFLVRFATPIPFNISKSGYSCSWCVRTSKWVYGESYQEACDKALVWHDDYIKQAKCAADVDA